MIRGIITKTFHLAALLLLLSAPATAFHNDSIPPKKNLSLIKLTNGSSVKGYIVSVSDSSIDVLSRKNYNRMQYANTQTLAAGNIESITKNFKNGLTAGKGALIGGGTGIALGVILALKDTCEDHNGDGRCDEGTGQTFSEGVSKSVLFGSVLGGSGAVIGLFSKKKDRVHYDIKGDPMNIRRNKMGLEF